MIVALLFLLMFEPPSVMLADAMPQPQDAQAMQSLQRQVNALRKQELESHEVQQTQQSREYNKALLESPTAILYAGLIVVASVVGFLWRKIEKCERDRERLWVKIADMEKCEKRGTA